MMKLPTNSESAAKMVRNVVKKLRPRSTASWFSAVISAPVSTSTSLPASACWIDVARASSSSEPSPTTMTESMRSG